MIQRTIENLRDRPKDERKHIALLISIGVMAVLFLGWLVYFVQTAPLAIQTVPQAYTAAVDGVQEAVDKTGWVSQRAPENGDQFIPQEILPAETEFVEEGSVELIDESSIISQ